MYTIFQKCGVGKIFFNVFEMSLMQPKAAFIIKNTVKTLILWNIVTKLNRFPL